MVCIHQFVEIQIYQLHFVREQFFEYWLRNNVNLVRLPRLMVIGMISKKLVDRVVFGRPVQCEKVLKITVAIESPIGNSCK